MAILMDGKALSDQVKAAIQADVLKITETRKPKLAVVLVGDDPASQIYVQSKIKACQQVGIESVAKVFDADITQIELLVALKRLNQDTTVDGILVQLPLPKHLDEQEVMLNISPEKDVDGFHPLNVGRLHLRQATFVPATPKGIIALIKAYNIDLEGKDVLVIGRSNLVGRPIAQLLLNENATVTIAHSRTQDLKQLTKAADVIVAAAGVMHLIQPDTIKAGVVLIDVGIHRDSNGKLTGDVAPSCYEKASYYTPVPKGVGPMTIAMLLKNTMQAYQRQVKQHEV
ncbi:MAG: bifunctional methylenetetrahydrofolate dehydrogenase/methenyltetrahydrofolate cyclohydrolase FolD [Erysipelothrix sp.]|jgi:methylenetetrahydrofolate dehydrogenase (NADP+)/methenyltetrahydrofolate cyclohydrolase|nr:bifunctional methylenetetrahydrofolate dehydrogenase/methenyltetrahydrofolate cyclohydrolase FolD [Erysipelothrix sp.]